MGDKVTCHEILAAAEKARGVKFKVIYESLDKLRTGGYTPIPANKAHAALHNTPEFDATPALMAMFAAIGTVMASGGLDIAEGESLNKEVPDIKTIKVVEFIEQYCSGKHA